MPLTQRSQSYHALPGTDHSCQASKEFREISPSIPTEKPKSFRFPFPRIPSQTQSDTVHLGLSPHHILVEDWSDW